MPSDQDWDNVNVGRSTLNVRPTTARGIDAAKAGKSTVDSPVNT
jgi:hypothetical protein